MSTIYDVVTAPELAAYWGALSQNDPPFLGEELFPARKQMGLDIKYLKGAKGLPIVLKPSAFDAKAVPRPRIAMDKVASDIPFFKESMYIDEHLRQELLKVLATGNQVYIDSVMNQIFDDQAALIKAARVQRERMRMSLLTSGAISIAANGQGYEYDYNLSDDQKVTAAKSWSDPTANIIDEVRSWLDSAEDRTGVRPTRGVCSRKTWGYLRTNQTIAKAIYPTSTGGVPVTDNQLRSALADQLGVEIVVNEKRYIDETGATIRYVPDDTLSLFPSGALGSTVFGTTPEEADLMSSSIANVSIVDTGVAVTTSKQVDPVNVETKVSMACLPTFEAADYILIADLTASS